MSQSLVHELDHNKLLALTENAKIVAIRWDLIPWGLVLDLDVPTSESKDALLYRAWLVFEGFSELTLPLKKTRLPVGCWLHGSLVITEVPNDFRLYSVSALLPAHSNDDAVVGSMRNTIEIKAKKVFGFRSDKEVKNDDAFSNRMIRNGLATDDEMLSVVYKSKRGR